MTVLIKRYANRKLYNTETSRYITLQGIAELIEQGTDVRVIDNETGEDITSVTLSQILVDSERSNRAVPRTLLSDLIQRSGDVLYGALKRGVGDASEGWGEFQRNVRRVIRSREEDGGRLRDTFSDARAGVGPPGAGRGRAGVPRARPAAPQRHRGALREPRARRQGARATRDARRASRRRRRAASRSASEVQRIDAGSRGLRRRLSSAGCPSSTPTRARAARRRPATGSRRAAPR